MVGFNTGIWSKLGFIRLTVVWSCWVVSVHRITDGCVFCVNVSFSLYLCTIWHLTLCHVVPPVFCTVFVFLSLEGNLIGVIHFFLIQYLSLTVCFIIFTFPGGIYCRNVDLSLYYRSSSLLKTFADNLLTLHVIQDISFFLQSKRN